VLTEDVIGAVRDLGPALAQRAAEIESVCRLPADVVDSLRAAAVFRMCTPRNHAGLEMDLPRIVDVICELSRIDGSIGWSVMIGCVSPQFFCRLPRTTFDTIYSESPDIILAGSTAPTGSAEPVDGGYRVSGRWPFASGCHHADWMFGACSVRAPDAPTDAPPQIHAAFLPAKTLVDRRTWHVAGLKGTGSKSHFNRRCSRSVDTYVRGDVGQNLRDRAALFFPCNVQPVSRRDGGWGCNRRARRPRRDGDLGTPTNAGAHADAHLASVQI
jgi:alkylation response protein AidB-like acyl-CoA dehydrogenase